MAEEPVEAPATHATENPNQEIYDAISNNTLTPAMVREAVSKKVLFQYNDDVPFLFF